MNERLKWAMDLSVCTDLILTNSFISQTGLDIFSSQ